MLVTMLDTAINKVVRLTVVTTTPQLVRFLGFLPDGVRSGVARDLDHAGEAYRFEHPRQRAYYLRRQQPGFMVWRWNHVASEREATQMQALIRSQQAPMNPYRANCVFERATGRTVGRPFPPDITPAGNGFDSILENQPLQALARHPSNIRQILIKP